MDNYLEKEFSIGEVMSLLILRNDFDDIGSVLKMKITQNISSLHSIAISFYTENKIQINQKNLVLFCNYENTLFDNVLLLSSFSTKNNNVYQLKLLNKEIAYMKMYINASYKSKGKTNQYSFAKVFDLKELKILSKEEIDELSLITGNDSIVGNLSIDTSNKNDNLSLILSEIDKVNQSLMVEKEKVDNDKKMIIDKEQKINQMIIDFKKEIYLFGDKCYGECLNEVNMKVNDVNKKLNSVENNIMNKYRIIKDKLSSANKTITTTSNVSTTGGNYKDKLANLEIKVKVLEDASNVLKKTIADKDEKIKNYISNEEKNSKVMKKLKDEIVILNSQLKDRKEKEKENSTLALSQSKKTSTSTINKAKTLISFDINKLQIQNYNNSLSQEMLMLSLSVDNYNSNTTNDKELTILSLLLMNISINPINLYNKYDNSIILTMIKLRSFFKLGSNSTYSSVISSTVDILYNKLSEFKASLGRITTKSIDKPIVNLLINNSEINYSDILYSKCNSFDTFITKTENKINKGISSISSSTVKNYNCDNLKMPSVSNSLLCILFNGDINEIYRHMSNIVTKYLYSKDKLVMKFLYLNKFADLVIKIYLKYYKNSTNKKSIGDYVNLMIDIMLIYHSNEYDVKEGLNEMIEDEGAIYERIKQNLSQDEEEDESEERMKIIKKSIMILVIMCGIKEMREKVIKKYEKEVKGIKVTKGKNIDKLFNKNILFIKSLIE